MRKKIERTIIDRAIETVAPQWGLRRFKARAALAISGGFTGASRNRPALSNWSPLAGDADADSVPDLQMLRARCRDLARNAPLTAGALNTVVTNVVGTGLSMRPSIDAVALGMDEETAADWQNEVEREWCLWAHSTDCDATRTQDIYGLQDLAFRSSLESGDVFAVTPSISDPNRPYRLAIQLIEADRVSNPGWASDKPNLVAGVETNGWGAPVAYHISRGHPGAYKRRDASMQWDTVAAFGANGRRNVLHLYRKTRPGQTRGIPYFASVIEPLKQLTRYTEAEIQAAVISAAFAVFVKMDPEAFDTLFDENGRTAYINSAAGWNGTVAEADITHPGKAVNLLPGESIESPDLGRPNVSFDPFVQAILRQIGVALELPFEVLIKHFTASYSAARAALLDAWKFFRGRRDFLATNFCQPIYELWLDEAVASGRVTAPGYFADIRTRAAYRKAKWIGDGPGAIDPLKEVKAAGERVDRGFSTIEAESILHDGMDWEPKHRQRVREEKMRREGGLAVVQVAETKDEEPTNQPDMARAFAESQAAIISAIGNQPAPVINIAPASINVEAPEINLSIPVADPTVVNVAAPNVNVSMPSEPFEAIARAMTATSEAEAEAIRKLTSD